MKRRQFIERLGLVGGALGLTIGGIPIRAFSTPWGQELEDDRILVLIQLAGGNDGLNTLVPFEDDIYYKNRPSIAIDKQTVLKVNSLQGFHPQLQGFYDLFDSGKMSIIQNVGYENPERSHFKSMDIWNSGSDSNHVRENGWAARYLTQLPEGLDETRNYPMAIDLGWSGTVLFDEVNLSHGLFINNIQEYLSITKEYVRPIDYASLSVADLEYDFIKYIAAQSNRYASRISEVSKAGKNNVEYPNTFLAKQLAIVAKLISGGLESKVYTAKLNGFDTHYGQLEQHTPLLKQVSEAVSVFQKDLEALGLSKRTTILIYSEFGRRLREGSQGTDHGSAAPLFVIGESVRGGIIGSNPNLSDLDQNGDLKYKFDYRQVYSTILKDHLQVIDTGIQSVLGDHYPTLPIFKNSIESYSSNLFHFDAAFPNPTQGEVKTTFQVTELVHVSFKLYSGKGQLIASFVDQNFFSGAYTRTLDLAAFPPGVYHLVMIVNGSGTATKSIVKV